MDRFTHAFDTIPRPVQTLLGKLGIDERFVRTFFLLCWSPKNFLSSNSEETSRPVEFLAASSCVYSTSLLALLAKEVSFPQTTFANDLAIWLGVYVVVMTLSVVFMHKDYLWFGFFRDRSKPKLIYRVRIARAAYMQGWWLISTTPLAVLVFLFPRFSEQIAAVYSFVIGVFFLRLVIHFHQINVRAYNMFIWIVLGFSVAVPIVGSIVSRFR